MKTLDEKIKELKLRAGAIQYSSVSVDDKGNIVDEKRNSDFANRIIAGYVFVWGVPNMHREVMLKGSCSKSILERGPNSNAKYKITFFWMHSQQDPLGGFEILEEDDYGLYFRTKPLDPVVNADRALTQIQSGTINQFSGGYDYVWDKIEYDSDNDLLILKEIDLFDISPVSIGSQLETFAFRSKEQVEYLHDETEGFIKSLPRNMQLEARNLFTRHKALMNKEPFEQRETTLNTDQPTKGRINYNYLKENL
jgi:HK97 family phage prohead protease